MELVQDIGQSLNLAGQTRIAPTSRSVTGLGSDDFFKLLITQLTNQDPLEPTGNEELLRQIASIRDIELSSNMTESLQSLTGQQRFAASSSLIGQFATGMADEDGAVAQGIVVGVRFANDGNPVLQLASGQELPIDRLEAIESPLVVGQSLVGRNIVAIDQRNANEPRLVEGQVTTARIDDNGETLLELDTGEDIRLRDVVSLAA